MWDTQRNRAVTRPTWREKDGANVTNGWDATPIAGAVRRRLIEHADQRGAFSELWRAGWTVSLTPRPFVQANLSRSRPGVLRGMHFHMRQADLWIILEGHATVGLVDLRDAADEPAWQPRTALLDLHRDDALYVPERVAHGFYAAEELSLLYLVTSEFDGRDEHGFAWDDRLAALSWPTQDPVLSARDRANQPLRDVVTRLVHGQIEGA